ncbi:MAG: DUF2793 domain-containing protein [Gammaproteobacteria bacterium]
MTTPILALDEIVSSQAGKELTHNTALRQLEGRLIRAKDKDLATPPGSPAEGDAYIIPAGATGVWASQTNKIAVYIGGGWVFYTPIEGVRLWINDEDIECVFDGTSWVVLAGAGLTPPFPDGTAVVKGSSDPTKQVRFEVDGLTTATTRVITVPDADITLADAPPFADTTAIAKGSSDATKKVRFEVDGLTTGTTRVMTVPDADITLGDNVYLAYAFLNGAPTANQIMLHHVVTRTVIFPSGLTGSQGKAGTAATAQTDFDIQKNGTSVGTMRFAAAATSATFIMASQQTFFAGDILKVIAPATPDTTLANITFTLQGTR